MRRVSLHPSVIEKRGVPSHEPPSKTLTLEKHAPPDNGLKLTSTECVTLAEALHSARASEPNARTAAKVTIALGRV